MFYVAELSSERYPVIQQIHLCKTSAEAINIGLSIIRDSGRSDEREADIDDELRREGLYRPTKYSDWSVCWGEIASE